MKAHKNFLSATNLDRQIQDFGLMIKHIRMVAATHKLETQFLNDLKMIRDIFPREILAKDIYKAIVE